MLSNLEVGPNGYFYKGRVVLVHRLHGQNTDFLMGRALKPGNRSEDLVIEVKLHSLTKTILAS